MLTVSDVYPVKIIEDIAILGNPIKKNLVSLANISNFDDTKFKVIFIAKLQLWLATTNSV